MEATQRPTFGVLWLAAVTCAAVSSAVPPAGGLKPLRLSSVGKVPYDPYCTSNWTLEPCVPFNNKCGAGFRLGSRAGELCRVLAAMFDCNVECVETDGVVHVERPARINRKLYQKYPNIYIKNSTPLTRPSIDYRTHHPGTAYAYGGCTYKAGLWERCSLVKLVKERQDSLVSSERGTVCSATRTIAMDCSLNEAENARERCAYSEWTQWSQCVNDTQSRSRNVTTGGSPCLNRTGNSRHCTDAPQSIR